MSKVLIGVVRVDNSAAALDRLEDWAALLQSRIAFWWLVMVSRVPLRRELARTAVHMLEVVWLLSAESDGLGTPTPEDLKGRESRARRSGGMMVRVVTLVLVALLEGDEGGLGDDRDTAENWVTVHCLQLLE